MELKADQLFTPTLYAPKHNVLWVNRTNYDYDVDANRIKTSNGTMVPFSLLTVNLPLIDWVEILLLFFSVALV